MIQVWEFERRRAVMARKSLPQRVRRSGIQVGWQEVAEVHKGSLKEQTCMYNLIPWDITHSVSCRNRQSQNHIQ